MLKLDTLFAFMGILLFFILVMLAQINPKAIPQITPPGNIVVSAGWPAGDTDIDIWVQYAGNRPVGYANKSGKIWSLLRDDLGNQNDVTPLNYESAFTRGIPDGEYIVNVRCFRCRSVPVAVDVEIRIVDGPVIYHGVVDLIKDKQERTVIRFRMATGSFVRGSENSVFKRLGSVEQ